MFSTLYDTYFSFSMHFKMSSAICFNLDQFKILSSGNGLNKKVENNLEKEKNAGYQNFLLVPKMFSKPFEFLREW